jgi:hypothetical protein
MLLGSPSLVTLTVSDLVWLVGEKISTNLTELRLELAFDHKDVDVWAMWCPASPAPVGVTSLSVTAQEPPSSSVGGTSTAPSYLAGASTCFRVFDRLERVSFQPPPSEAFWDSASDLSLSRVRDLTLLEWTDEAGTSVNHLCSWHLLKNAARFTNLVKLRLVDSCDFFNRMVNLDVAFPKLEVLKMETCFVPEDIETWTCLPPLLPSLNHLECIKTTGDFLESLVIKEVLAKGFANLRVIYLEKCSMSFDECLIMTVEVLKRHPTKPVFIRCSESSGAADPVTEMAVALLDGLRMIPSCRVKTVPQLVDEYSGAWSFQLDLP